MTYQTIFRRYELKYLLTQKQKALLTEKMNPYMTADPFGPSTIRNIYYDTDSYRLIRRSLEKPAYKEKLRIRSYAKATDSSDIFVELKKKYRSVVYKRRLLLPEQQTMDWLAGKAACPLETQISKEIDYFHAFYQPLRPVVFLSYEREAFYSPTEADFRITFDENILYRQEELSLEAEIYGTPLLEEGQVLMELKTAGGLPLWMTHFLTEQQLRKTSFSKYGAAYQRIATNREGGAAHV